MICDAGAWWPIMERRRPVSRLRCRGVVPLLEPITVPPGSPRAQQEHKDDHQPVIPQLVEVEIGRNAATKSTADLMPWTARNSLLLLAYYLVIFNMGRVVRI